VRICIYTLLGASGTVASGHHDNNEQKPVTRPAINLEGRPEYRSRQSQRFYFLRQKTMLQEVGRRLDGSQIFKRVEKSRHWTKRFGLMETLDRRRTIAIELGMGTCESSPQGTSLPFPSTSAINIHGHDYQPLLLNVSICLIFRYLPVDLLDFPLTWPRAKLGLIFWQYIQLTLHHFIRLRCPPPPTQRRGHVLLQERT
jgi:hypothetical protein